MIKPKEVLGYRCKVCGYFYSKVELDLAKFDPCALCGNIFKNTHKWDIVYNEKTP